MTTFAPLTPQPAATRDGVGLDPLAGGFLPPYAERLDLRGHGRGPARRRVRRR